MSRLPAQVVGSEVQLRLWRVDDAARLGEAVGESAKHLQPWMAWMADEPQTPEQRRAMLARWESEWSDGGDAYYGIFLDSDVAGSCGLHRRVGQDALEIGYWIHAAFVRRGLATEAARLLTDAAFSMPEISSVEIHHDRANLASSGVPSRLGYRFVGEQPDEAIAPEDTGVECIWRIESSEWRQRPTIRTAAGPGHSRASACARRDTENLRIAPLGRLTGLSTACQRRAPPSLLQDKAASP